MRRAQGSRQGSRRPSVSDITAKGGGTGRFFYNFFTSFFTILFYYFFTSLIQGFYKFLKQIFYKFFYSLYGKFYYSKHITAKGGGTGRFFYKFFLCFFQFLQDLFTSLYSIVDHSKHITAKGGGTGRWSRYLWIQTRICFVSFRFDVLGGVGRSPWLALSASKWMMRSQYFFLFNIGIKSWSCDV